MSISSFSNMYVCSHNSWSKTYTFKSGYTKSLHFMRVLQNKFFQKMSKNPLKWCSKVHVNFELHFGGLTIIFRQSCQSTEREQSSVEVLPQISCLRVDSESATRGSDLSVTANMLVARSHASLKRRKHWAWGSLRAVSSQQLRLANGHPSLMVILEPTLGKNTRAGENPWASASEINGWFVLLLRGSKQTKTQVARMQASSASLLFLSHSNTCLLYTSPSPRD